MTFFQFKRRKALELSLTLLGKLRSINILLPISPEVGFQRAAENEASGLLLESSFTNLNSREVGHSMPPLNNNDVENLHLMERDPGESLRNLNGHHSLPLLTSVPVSLPKFRRTEERTRSQYVYFQSLFKRDPKRIATHLIKNQPLENVSCPTKVAEVALRQRLSQHPEVDAAPFTAKCPPNSRNILSPVFSEEVTLHLKQMSAKTSAGLDGFQMSHIRNCDPVCLAKAFNCFLARRIPLRLKDCQTTLIPKTHNPLPDAEDYRPITITCCIYLLFSKIVTRRLENCISLHPHQKAFRSGTVAAFDNVTTIMKEAHKRGRELNIVFVDLARAFDTINHTSVDRALCMHRLDADSRHLIAQMVTGSTTVIKGNGGVFSNKIEINQGDPVSPLLFNSVMDELIERLKQSGDTSKAFRIPNCGEESFHVPMVGPGNLIKVLGVNIAPSGKPFFDLATLEGTLERIQKAPLKPAQKLATVRDYLISALEYQLRVPRIGKKILEDIDASIRQSDNRRRRVAAEDPRVRPKRTEEVRRRGRNAEPKCKTLSICNSPKTKKMFTNQELRFTITDSAGKQVLIPSVGARDTFRYLGHLRDSEGRIIVGLDKTTSMLSRVGSAKLKPEQKVDIIRSHLIPRLLFWFSTPFADCRKAALIDRLIRGRIITRRLNDVIQLNDYQKAFRKGINGTFENTAILSTLFNDGKNKSKEIYIALLDLTKAFDSVQHNTILAALRSKNLNLASINLISDMLQDTTFAEIKELKGPSIQISSGVRQGDPISPLLFCIFIDSLLDRLTAAGPGYKLKGINVPVLTFADDLILVSNSAAGLKILLNTTSTFFSNSHMSANPAKCKTLSICNSPKTRKMFTNQEIRFSIMDSAGKRIPIPSVGVKDTFRYLGHLRDGEGRIIVDLDKAARMLSRVESAKLKPEQKVDIIRSHLIPRLLFWFNTPFADCRKAALIDRLIRGSVKRILHSTTAGICTNFFYIPSKNGGLGLTSLEEHARFSAVKALTRMASGRDVLGKMIADLCLPKSAIKDPKTLRQLANTIKAKRLEEFGKSYQGTGWKEFQQNKGNSWIRNGRAKGRNYIMAIKLRTNTAASRTENQRGRPGIKSCRKCHAALETLAHICQKCPASHGMVIKRHNAIVDSLCDAASKQGFTVHKELKLPTPAGTLKSDIILVKSNKASIIDVGICWEGGRPLRLLHRQKAEKCQAAIQSVRELLKVDEADSQGFVIGSRGAWPKENEQTLKAAGLSLSKKMKDFLCWLSLENSIRIYSAFMKG
ncbi:Retrovirus-related Pol polyprotein from type-1 retrotransposable element [Trichinella papuae]|uniref:Retrovirus-related Pol polyprotein from type-1 retrotransposable element n=1 Tax=Trichinella papuae TaxID=268474 RepID=A0A0V1M1I5_9BILA|nr:Retrovirus-related Pol polyprotein from type-1 retrotransposable element [Trichinella papuae]